MRVFGSPPNVVGLVGGHGVSVVLIEVPMNSVATGGPSKLSKFGGTLRTEWTWASPVMTIGLEGRHS